jgi:hypothetical protein
MPAPAAIGKAVVVGGKILVTLVSVYQVVKLTKMEIDGIIQDATPMIDNANGLPPKEKRDLTEVYPEAKELFDMVKDSNDGKYAAECSDTVAAAVCSIGHLINEDFNPDTVKMDDIKSIMYAVGYCAKEIARYKKDKGIKDGEVGSDISTDPYK